MRITFLFLIKCFFSTSSVTMKQKLVKMSSKGGLKFLMNLVPSLSIIENIFKIIHKRSFPLVQVKARIKCVLTIPSFLSPPVVSRPCPVDVVSRSTVVDLNVTNLVCKG
jgi:hypothetical protein